MTTSTLAKERWNEEGKVGKQQLSFVHPWSLGLSFVFVLCAFCFLLDARARRVSRRTCLRMSVFGETDEVE